VVVERDNVTLIGTDPVLDGIRGMAMPEPFVFNNTLLVRNSLSVRVKNLSLVGDARCGLRLVSSLTVDVVNCQILGHPQGLNLGGGSWASVTDTVVTATFLSVFAYSGGDVTVTGGSCSSDNLGMYAYDGATIAVMNSNVDADYLVVAAVNNGTVTIEASDISGGVHAWQKGGVVLDGVTQAANPLGYNYANLDSTIGVSGGSSLLGDTELDGFSQLWLHGGSSLDGNSTCSSGSDAACDPFWISGGVYGCSSCQP
jgi:hypothetical protein